MVDGGATWSVPKDLGSGKLMWSADGQVIVEMEVEARRGHLSRDRRILGEIERESRPPYHTIPYIHIGVHCAFCFVVGALIQSVNPTSLGRKVSIFSPHDIPVPPISEPRSSLESTIQRRQKKAQRIRKNDRKHEVKQRPVPCKEIKRKSRCQHITSRKREREAARIHHDEPSIGRERPLVAITWISHREQRYSIDQLAVLVSSPCFAAMYMYLNPKKLLPNDDAVLYIPCAQASW